MIVDDVPLKQGMQCDIPTFGNISIENVQHENKIINFYTGF